MSSYAFRARTSGEILTPDQLRQRESQRASFGATVTPDVADALGYDVVQIAPPPEHDAAHELVPADPQIIGGQWTQGWTVRALAPQALAANAQALATKLRAELFAEYERRCAAISAGYPNSERESWPVQTSEASALLADVSASTPWIDAAAAARGLERAELAARIAALDNAYRTIHGGLTGARQRIEDDINAAAGDLAALSQIDVAAGWPVHA